MTEQEFIDKYDISTKNSYHESLGYRVWQHLYEMEIEKHFDMLTDYFNLEGVEKDGLLWIYMTNLDWESLD